MPNKRSSICKKPKWKQSNNSNIFSFIFNFQKLDFDVLRFISYFSSLRLTKLLESVIFAFHPGSSFNHYYLKHFSVPLPFSSSSRF